MAQIPGCDISWRMSKIALRKLCGTYGRCTPVETSQVMNSPSVRASGTCSRRSEESACNLAIICLCHCQLSEVHNRGGRVNVESIGGEA